MGVNVDAVIAMCIMAEVSTKYGTNEGVRRSIQLRAGAGENLDRVRSPSEYVP